MNNVLTTMEDVESMHVVETPCVSVNSSSQDSADSGYLSILTPQTSSCTPKVTGRTRSSTGALFSAKKHRYRPDPFLREKVQRYRSKFNHRLNTLEHNTSDYLVSENPVEQDSVLEACTHVNQNLSLVHSTPSCVNNDLDKVLRNRRNWRTMVPVTPASTDFQILSPPPSPAVPSSYVASEPIPEDTEMKLVCTPRSKSQRITTPSKLKVVIPRIVISPIHTRSSPVITSADNRKLRDLCITDLTATSEIKPKKLDFSHRGLCASLRNNRRVTLDYTGREKVDFFSLLGEESNHLNLVSKILSFLSPQDLCSASMVSTVWRKICKSDSCANRRKMNFIMRKHTMKENLWLLMAKKAKREEDIQTSPKSRRYVRKGYLLDVQNLLQVPAQPNSPPVSPSKIKFHSFVKASRTLANGEYLLPCPRCSFPCHVNSEKNVGACSRQGCSIEFCISCSSKPHAGPCKTPLLATPTKRNNKRLIVGSRQSKRNLRRL